MIPVCSATFSYASGSSDSQLEPCLDRLGIGRLDWRLPSMPYVQGWIIRPNIVSITYNTYYINIEYNTARIICSMYT